MITHRNPARLAEIAAASPHGPPPTITRSTASGMSKSDDLIATRAHAHVRDSRFDELLQPIEIGPGLGRQIGEPATRARRTEPAVEPLVSRRDLVERRHVAGEFRV